MNSSYNPFQFLFYPMILVLLAGGIYLVYQNNSALMDQLSLIEKQQKTKKTDLFVIESPAAKSAELWEIGKTQVLSHSNDKSHPSGQRFDHRYDFYKDGPSIEDKNADWLVDTSGIIISNDNKIDVYTRSGELQWSLESEKELCDGPVAASDKLIIACYKDGGLVTFSRDKGLMLWARQDQKKYLRNPLLLNASLFTFEEGEKSTWTLAKTDLKTGEESGAIKSLPMDYLTPASFSSAKEFMLIAEKSGSVRAYNLKTMQAQWKSDITGDFSSPVAISGDRAYVINPEGNIYALNLNNGELAWEYSINKPSHQAITVAEGLGIGAITDDDGYLHMIDVRDGKRKWRFNTKTSNKNKDMVAVRLKMENALKLNMGSEGQGWLFWGPCKDNEVCAYEPFKGLLVRRIEPPKGSEVQFPPLYMGSDLMALLVEEAGTRKFKIYGDRDMLNRQKEQSSEDDAVDKTLEDN